MTPEQLDYRSVAVPDSLRAESQTAAASHRFAAAAGLDVAQDPNLSRQSQVGLADAARVVERAIEVTTAGEAMASSEASVAETMAGTSAA